MFPELLLALIGIGLVAGLFVCTLVLPIIAFVRTRRIARLAARIEQVEAELRAGMPARVPAEVVSAPSAETPGQPASLLQQEQARQLAELAARLDRLEEHVQRVRPAARQEPAQAPAPSPPSRRRSGESPAPSVPEVLPAAPWEGIDAAAVEAWLGRRGLGWVAVVLLLFATAFFLKYAFDNRWIGELGRVALGILTGVALCGGGLHYHRQGWRIFSPMLSAGGVVLLYLAIFAAFGYYHLIPREPAAGFLIVLVAETAALAALYEAPAIALMAVLGGLLVPILLHTEHDQYRSLFTYLLVLNAGFAGLALFRHWRAIGTVALLGTQGLFWLWYGEHYHPEKLAAALGFQTALFGLYLGYGIGAPILRRRPAGAEDLVRLVLNACLFAAAGYVLLDEDYHAWMGTLAVAMATVYAALGWLVLRWRPEDARQLLVVVATAMAFVAAAIPLQAAAAWIPVGWAVQGFALWAFAVRIRAPLLRSLGAVLLILAVGRLVFVDTPYTGRAPFIPLVNKYGVPAALVAACVLGSAIVSRRSLGRLGPADRTLVVLTGLGGIALVWFILSLETYTYFTARMDLPGADADYLGRSAQTALSVVWAGYAVVVLGLGFRLRSEPLRWAALGVFALTLAKVFVVDMAGLPGLYRVLAFFVLALMMGGAAWGYQKVQRLAEEREVLHHEAR